ncbi:MAG TPA: SRPBCC family protein [Candidatus Limnocylindrales bacterium]|nr:SRPBCC family protein [Candidatus Limnocylindrales bacterium]
MSEIIETIDVDVPVRTAYDQWTQFEEFPRFMEGVESVKQLTDTTLEWTAKIAGVERSWRAEITEQEPDQRVAWQSTSGARNAGVVTFHRLADRRSRVTLQLDIEPTGPVETVGDAVGAVERRVEGDLKRFKEFIEGRGDSTGAWRGEVDQDRVTG